MRSSLKHSAWWLGAIIGWMMTLLSCTSPTQPSTPTYDLTLTVTSCFPSTPPCPSSIPLKVKLEDESGSIQIGSRLISVQVTRALGRISMIGSYGIAETRIDIRLDLTPEMIGHGVITTLNPLGGQQIIGEIK